jgi:L-seryl-tRNA(Ser) seleniumtransferase
MNNDLFRQIPQLNDMLSLPGVAALEDQWSRGEIVAALRDVLDQLRADLRAGGGLPDFASAEFAGDVAVAMSSRRRLNLRPVINGTGIIIHTNLGRAPLAPTALLAIDAAAKGYANIEFDLDSGKRGSRYDHIRDILTDLTGAEDAVVVNNCAAAVTIAMATFAKGREVIVSRGELVEIGGSFRVPDVITQNGAHLVEVGTTNKTHMADYERAVSENTAVILRTHTSNYKLLGFTAKPGMEELADFAHSHDLLLVEDLGSGTLIDLSPFGIGDEPTVGASIAAGADLVTFSGDKLLGGPQAGIMVGRADLIAAIRKNPLLRAMRVDKLSLAALEATLRLYQAPFQPETEVPVLAMLTAKPDTLEPVASELSAALNKIDGVVAEVAPVKGEAGGGSLPGIELASFCVTITIGEMGPQQVITALRDGDPAIIGRIVKDKALLDVRTLMPGDPVRIVASVEAIAAS